MDCTIKKNCTHRQKGFSLVEVLVSLFVLSIGIIGVFALITFNFSSTREVKNNLIAAGLVQEGMEVARNMRDSFWHEDEEFADLFAEGSYRVQWDSDALLPMADNPPLLLAMDGSYTYDIGEPTLFHREIIIEKPSPIEMIVTTEVTWKGRGGENTLNAEMHLYDWK